MLLLLFFGLQRPLSIMEKQLNKNGKYTYALERRSSTCSLQPSIASLRQFKGKVKLKWSERRSNMNWRLQEISNNPYFQPCSSGQGAGYCSTCFACDEVGGDFYDFIPLSDNRLGLVIADVSGKGVPAALIMALSRALIRVYALQDHAITAVVEKTNTLIMEFASSEYFVTLFYAIVAGVEITCAT